MRARTIQCLTDATAFGIGGSSSTGSHDVCLFNGVRSHGGGQSTGREGESNLSALYELIGKQKRIPGSSREVDWVVANSGVVTCPQVPYSGKNVYEWNLSDKKVAFAADEDREQNLRPCK
jgi:hypothetical protein